MRKTGHASNKRGRRRGTKRRRRRGRGRSVRKERGEVENWRETIVITRKPDKT